MAIELHGDLGAVIFLCVLIFFEIFCGTIGYLIISYFGFTGWIYWVLEIGFVLIMNLIFVNTY